MRYWPKHRLSTVVRGDKAEAVAAATYRDADRITSEAGSRGVAMEVTQPLWPFSTPRRERFSAIVSGGRCYCWGVLAIER
jgi:hypothetical protein